MKAIYIVLIVLALGLFYIDKLLKRKYDIPRSIQLLYFVNKIHKNIFIIFAFTSIIAIFAAQVKVERMGKVMSLIWIEPITLLAIILFGYCIMRSYFVKKVDKNLKEANYFFSWSIVALVYGVIIFFVDYFFI